MAKRSKKVKNLPPDSRQKGRQQGCQTGREAFKSNSRQDFRHPGQGMRGKDGGQREAARQPSQESTGSDTRKHKRPKSER